MSRFECDRHFPLYVWRVQQPDWLPRTGKQALPEKSLDEIRTIGPSLMLQIMAILGAVIRRCNAILSGGLVGVDALGEKVSSP